MAQVHLKVKFGNPNHLNYPSLFTISAEIEKDQITSHYKKFSTRLSKYRLPLVVVDMPSSFQGLQFIMIEKMLSDSVVNEKLIKGQRCYSMYESKQPEQIVMLKKLEKMLQKLTTLHNSMHINFIFQDLTAKRAKILEDNSRFCYLALENLFIDAKLSLDSEFIKILGESVAKVSPGFDKSPIIAFLDLFQESSLNLEFQNPSVLKQNTLKQVFPKLLGFEEPGTESEQDKLVKKMLDSDEKIIVYIHFGKLGYLKFSGQARIWGYMCCLDLS